MCEYAAACDARALHIGSYGAWLTKVKSDEAKAKWLSSSTKRFFTIDFNSQLFFYSQKEDRKTISQPVRFKDIICAEHLPRAAQPTKHSSEHTFGFTVKTMDRVYELYTITYLDATHWVDALNAARDLANSSPATGPSASFTSMTPGVSNSFTGASMTPATRELSQSSLSTMAGSEPGGHMSLPPAWATPAPKTVPRTTNGYPFYGSSQLLPQAVAATVVVDPAPATPADPFAALDALEELAGPPPETPSATGSLSSEMLHEARLVVAGSKRAAEARRQLVAPAEMQQDATAALLGIPAPAPAALAPAPAAPLQAPLAPTAQAPAFAGSVHAPAVASAAPAPDLYTQYAQYTQAAPAPAAYMPAAPAPAPYVPAAPAPAPYMPAAPAPAPYMPAAPAPVPYTQAAPAPAPYTQAAPAPQMQAAPAPAPYMQAAPAPDPFMQAAPALPTFMQQPAPAPAPDPALLIAPPAPAAPPAALAAAAPAAPMAPAAPSFQAAGYSPAPAVDLYAAAPAWEPARSVADSWDEPSGSSQPAPVVNTACGAPLPPAASFVAAKHKVAAATQGGDDDLDDLVGEMLATGNSGAGHSLVEGFHCTGCDFQVMRIDEFIWDGSVDYMFFRNNYPTFEKLRKRLHRQPGCCCYCCQCSWKSADRNAELADVAEGLRWRTVNF